LAPAPARYPAVGLRVTALDIEEHEVEVGEELVIDAIPEIAGRLDRRMEP